MAQKRDRVDVAINYKAPDFKGRCWLADVWLDNVGGDILNFMMTSMATKVRMTLCGTSSPASGVTDLVSNSRHRFRLQYVKRNRDLRVG